jgi:hypothetical protein
MNLTKSKLLIVLYWTLITVVVLYDRKFLAQKAGLGHFIECIVVRVSLLMGLAYLNLKLVMPLLLEKEKKVAYVLLTVLSISVYILLQQVYDIYLYGFVLGYEDGKSYRAASFYLVFSTIWYLVITLIFYKGLEWYGRSEQIKELELEIQTLKEKEATLARDNGSSEMFVKSGTKKVRVDIEAVTHVQGLKDYAIIFMPTGKLIVKGTLKNVDDMFPAGTLVRIHKSFLVAKRRISSISSSKVTIGDLVIPVGRSYKSNVESIL